MEASRCSMASQPGPEGPILAKHGHRSTSGFPGHSFLRVCIAEAKPQVRSREATFSAGPIEAGCLTARPDRTGGRCGLRWVPPGDYRSPATAAPLNTATSTTSATTTAAAPFVRDVLDNDMPHPAPRTAR